MTFIVFIVEVLFSLICSSFLLYFYGNVFKQNPLVTICTLIVWFFSLIIIFLLPLDISSYFYNVCQAHSTNITNSSCHRPYSYIQPTAVKIIWYLLYWILQLLSWILLPFFQSFVTIHYFSIWKKLLWSLIQNGIVLLSLIFVALLIMIFLLVKENWDFNLIISLAVTASNVWVLFFLILLLGYGLIELPRQFYKRSNYSKYLHQLYFQIAKIQTDRLEVDIKMEELERELKRISEIINFKHPHRKHFNSILAKLPREVAEGLKGGFDDFEEYNSKYNRDSANISFRYLEKLHETAIKTTPLFYRLNAQWNSLLKSAIRMEDNIKNKNNPKYIFVNSFKPHPFTKFQLLMSRIEYVWRIWLLRILYLVVFGISLLLSFLIFISEITIFLNQFARITPLSYLAHLSNYSNEYLSTELISLLLLGYISCCSYYTVFKMRIFNKYVIAPGHYTDEFSLLFSAILLSRLITSMCLNYLYLIDLARLPNSNKLTYPTFFDIWGSTVPDVAVIFFVYFPLAIIIVVISTVFQLDRRILSFLGFQQFIGDDEFTSELVDEGKEYVRIERNSMERQERRKNTLGKSDAFKEYRKRVNTRNRNIAISDDILPFGGSMNKTSFAKDVYQKFYSYLPQKKSSSNSAIRYSRLHTTSPLDSTANTEFEKQKSTLYGKYAKSTEEVDTTAYKNESLIITENATYKYDNNAGIENGSDNLFDDI